MRTISSERVTSAVKDLCVKANVFLAKEMLNRLRSAHSAEKNSSAKRIIEAIIKNAGIAAKEGFAICQDTGMPCVFVEIGQDVRIEGDFKKAINKGIDQGYKEASLRSSVIKDPLKRGKPGYTPAVIHTEITGGSKLKLTVLPKGFGCENKAQLKMFNPTVKIDQVREFIIGVVKNAGPDACPPYVVGIGVGGTADYAMLLAKKALLKKIGRPLTGLERRLLKEINKLNIGPMGLGGKNTCLSVNIETYPTHIAGLPVAVNISCHALRSATAVL
ncbi:MAG: fumarate hydratase [Candidatus Omnitrophica bacterium]|nr:fumarate hydratase [Candidatus Omnitrophota bacterium]